MNKFSNKGKPWNNELIWKLLLTINILDQKRFIITKKLIIYFRALLNFITEGLISDFMKSIKWLSLKKCVLQS